MPVVQISPTMIVEVEQFDHGGQLRKRTVRAAARPRGTARRTVSTPLACWPGDGSPPDARVAHTEGGHLVPLELGGADHAANLVPMYGAVNRGTYRGVERELRDLLAAQPQPMIVVAAAYPQSTGFAPVDGRVPTAFTVGLHANVATFEALSGSAPVKAWTVPNIRVAPSRMVIEGDDIDLRRRLLFARYTHNPGKWLLERDVEGFASFAANLPPPDRRPNAWLDRLIYDELFMRTGQALLSKITPGVFTVGPGFGFTLQQREFVLLANRMTQPDERKGEIWSDMSNDPIGTALTELGTEDGAHIDHIKPKADNGANVYSNAAVTSASFNTGKGRS